MTAKNTRLDKHKDGELDLQPPRRCDVNVMISQVSQPVSLWNTLIDSLEGGGGEDDRTAEAAVLC